MKKTRVVLTWRPLMAVALAALVTTVPAQIEPAKDAPQPRPPEQSIKMFHLKDGFTIELVASEPLLADPVDIDWDAQGRIFVAELHGYNMEGHYDIQELNKTGILDMKVRRIYATEEARKRAEPEMFGTVKLLVDKNGDGRMDEAQVWADRLPPCYGVAVARDGVIALCPPDIYFLADRDADGKAEVKETLFTGFNIGEMWARSNNLRHGEDNWIYAVGGRGSKRLVTGPKLENPVELGVTNYRFKPDGSAIEPVTGSAGGFGQSRTDWGDSFGIANSIMGLYIVPLPHRYLTRNPYVGAPGDHTGLAGYREVFPTSEPHPWRQRRGTEGEWIKFYGRGEASPNGSFTAACSPFIYRAEAFPKEYWGSYFSCECQQNLVHHAVLYEEGAALRVKRAEDEQNREFLTSDEGWFRPVNLRLGPDGAIYVVDMYREIIEDYSAIPRYLQQQYGLDQGLDRGRIWRVRYKPAPKTPKPALDQATIAQLVAQLENPNAWWRLTAQRLLTERQDRAAVAPLKKLLLSSKSPVARLHVLHSLDALGAVNAPATGIALSDEHPGVRRHGLRLAERFLDQSPPLLNQVASMVKDPDAKARLQVAMTLGESRSDQAIVALGQLGSRHGAERWMDSAIASSVADRADRLLETLLKLPGDSTNRLALIGPLSATVGARRKDEEVVKLLVVAVALAEKQAVALQRACLTGLIKGLKRVEAQRLESADGQSALSQLFETSDREIYRMAFELVGLLKVNDSPILRKAFTRAGTQVLEQSLELDQRLAELELLSNAPFDQVLPIGLKLLDARQPSQLQVAAVKAIAKSRDGFVVNALLSGWVGHSPVVRKEVIDALFARTERLPALMEAMKSGLVAPSNLSAFQRVQLLENPDPKISSEAKKLLVQRVADGEREELLQRYLQALGGKRDPAHGKQVFNQVCIACHQMDGQGGNVGPELSSANGRTDRTLLNDILLPNDQITVGFRTYIVETADGNVVTGRLAAETATSVVLRQPLVPDQVVLRRDIKRMQGTDQSLMPEQIEQLLSPTDVADLIAFLRQHYGKASNSRLTLFDDEKEFVNKLKDGKGTATLDHDAFSGVYALAVTPPQKYSARISGWAHRIVENPKSGEYRYLRLAWKTREKTDGVLLELAANGSWPSSGSPYRRYYSGRNTTKWKALQVSTQAPTTWTTVTMDLWKDCGEFTLTGVAPTAMGGTVLFDRIELLGTLDGVGQGER